MSENKKLKEIEEVLRKFLRTRKDGIFKEGLGMKHDSSVVVDYINKHYIPISEVEKKLDGFFKLLVDKGFIEHGEVYTHARVYLEQYKTNEEDSE